MISKSESFQFFQIWQSESIERISEVFRSVGLGDEFYFVHLQETILWDAEMWYHPLVATSPKMAIGKPCKWRLKWENQWKSYVYTYYIHGKCQLPHLMTGGYIYIYISWVCTVVSCNWGLKNNQRPICMISRVCSPRSTEGKTLLTNERPMSPS